MAKKNSAAPREYGTGTTGTPAFASAGTGGKGAAGGGKNVQPPSAYGGQQAQLGYEIGAPSGGLGPIGMVGSPLQAQQDALNGLQSGVLQHQAGYQPTGAPWGKINAGNQVRSAMQSQADALRGLNNMGGGRVSFPMAAQGGVPGQNSREGYDENGNYIVNGPGNYDAYGNALYPQQVAAEAQWANMASEPTGPAVNINGVMMQPMRRADGSVYTTALDANGQPQQATNRTDMGI